AHSPARVGTPGHRGVRRDGLLSTLLERPFWSHRLKAGASISQANDNQSGSLPRFHRRGALLHSRRGGYVLPVGQEAAGGPEADEAVYPPIAGRPEEAPEGG